MKTALYALAFIGIFLALTAQEEARIKKLETHVKSLQFQVGALGRRVSALQKAIKSLQAGPKAKQEPLTPSRPARRTRTFKEYTQPDSKVQPKEVIVYVTKTGKKYHRAGCRYLSRSKISIGLQKAKTSGYTPCSVCVPPK